MGMDNVKIDRINALAHKAKSVGLMFSCPITLFSF